MNRIYTCVYRAGEKTLVTDVVCQSDIGTVFAKATKKLQLKKSDQILAMVPGQHASYTLLPVAAGRDVTASTADLDARDRFPGHHLNSETKQSDGLGDYVPNGF